MLCGSILDTVCTYTGVYLSLKGVVYPNNSDIMISEIGETDTSENQPPNSNNGFQCVTDRIPCCRFQGGQQGEWYFPNGTAVTGQGTTTSFYTSRGRDDGTVILNRVSNDVMMPTGQYCCIVPDATGVNRSTCIMICELYTSTCNISCC